MHYLEIGGAEISLIGLLQALDPQKIDVDLFIYSHRGPLMKYIPNWVNLLPENPVYAAIEIPLLDTIKLGHWKVAYRRLVAKWKHFWYRHKKTQTLDDSSIMQYIGDYVTPVLPRINPNRYYDLAISFLTPHNIVRDKVMAKLKVAWIHTDYSTVSVNVEQELPVWSAYNYIISISQQVTDAFLKTFPTLKPKIIEIENILSPSFVRSRANEFDVDETMNTNLK